MKIFQTIFEKLCRLGLGAAFACLIATVLIQVIARIFGSSPVWTEEVARFSLLHIAAFGTGLSLLTGELVNVDVICESFKGHWPWIFRLISAVSVSSLSLVLMLPALDYVSIGHLQTSAALGIRMNFIHTSVLILIVVLFVFSTLRAVAMIRGTDDGLPFR